LASDSKIAQQVHLLCKVESVHQMLALNLCGSITEGSVPTIQSNGAEVRGKQGLRISAWVAGIPRSPR